MQGRFSIVSPDAEIGAGVRIYDFVNIYGAARIGAESVVGAFAEIQPGVVVGERVKISSHSFLCTGVTVEDEAFIGHGVMFTNDKRPRSVFQDGTTVRAEDTEFVPTVVCRRAVIGSGCTILCGVTIGPRALVGAGSVVTRDVPADTLVMGNPARVVRSLDSSERG